MKNDFSDRAEIEDFGHHFLVSIAGSSLTEEERHNLSELHPLGLVLSARNFNSSLPYEQWIRELKQLLSEAAELCQKDKLLVALEEEGGEKHELPDFLTSFPPPREYFDKAATVAAAMAEELKSLGVNVLLAPPADVAQQRMKTEAGRRAFSDFLDDVIKASCNFSVQMLKDGILPCPGNFPGEGGAMRVSKGSLPGVSVSREELIHRDLKPFAALAAVEVPAMRAAGVLYSALDPDCPAFMSRTVMNILREHLKFNGLVISPDLSSAPVKDFFTEPEIIKCALAAGCDAFMVSDLNQACRLAGYMIDAFKIKAVPEEDFVAADFRILNFHKKAAAHEPYPLSEEIIQSHLSLASEVKDPACV